jgi:exopolysaccharide biosynthesis polyprenyl glycosylphosphotransferase
MDELPQLVERENIDRIFIPSSKLISNGYSEIVDICRKRNIKLKVLSPESDRLLSMTHVHDIAGITLYAPVRWKVLAFRRIMKRIFDIVVSSLLILLLTPVFLLCSAAIFLESGRPIFFKHKRTAVKGGKEFDFYKFRSMIDGADELKEELFEFNETDGALFKMRNDPRMTKVGKFIRKFSIDEIPQLFNVLKGDMSLVGPRPLPPSDFERLEEGPEFWEAVKYRGKMKPGITGLWQISGRSHIGFREMILLDLYYVENQSLLFDLEILFETVPVVLFGKGAY